MYDGVRSAVLAVVLVASSVIPFGEEHVVVPGETLSEIAKAHGTTVKNLAEANDIDDIDLIWSGQVLIIPGTGSTSTVYVVKAGDTLAEIATMFGVTSAEIAAANNLASIDLILIGQRLSIGVSDGSGGGDGGDGDDSSGGDGDEGGGAVLDGDGILHPSITHVVKSGETLSQIAVKYNTSSLTLKELNGLEDANRIFPGQVLRVPGEAPFVCPLADAWYSNDWGFPRPGGRTHEGNDLFAPYGAPVFAPASGSVEYIDGSLGGLQFWLTAYDGTLYIGTHLSAFGESTTVLAGDVVGYIGDTGNAKGLSPHLHFEIHPPGMNAVNPYPTLQANGC